MWHTKLTHWSPASLLEHSCPRSLDAKKRFCWHHNFFSWKVCPIWKWRRSEACHRNFRWLASSWFYDQSWTSKRYVVSGQYSYSNEWSTHRHAGRFEGNKSVSTKTISFVTTYLGRLFEKKLWTEVLNSLEILPCRWSRICSSSSGSSQNCGRPTRIPETNDARQAKAWRIKGCAHRVGQHLQQW